MGERTVAPIDTADIDEDYRLLRDWGVIHRCHFSWRPSPGRTMTVTGPKRRTHAEAVADTHRLTKRAGYEPPRWWQWWRWGEYPLPEVREDE